MQGRRRLDVETRATAWFALYYQLGAERSLGRLHSFLGELGVKVSVGTLENYSVRFGWHAKVAELNEKARQKTEEQTIDTVADMNLRHITLAKALSGVAAGALGNMRGRLDQISGGEVARMLEVSQRIERLALGEVTDRREIIIGIVNVLVKAVVLLFMEVNHLPDEQERIDRFAVGLDEAVDRYLVDATKVVDNA
jgi:hypothetical protein